MIIVIIIVLIVLQYICSHEIGHAFGLAHEYVGLKRHGFSAGLNVDLSFCLTFLE